MSYWNFYGNFSPQLISLANLIPGRVGEELQRCPDDVHELWRGWMTRACFPWEHDGYPGGSVLHHAQTWWDYGHLPNILPVHFADLLVAGAGFVTFGRAGFVKVATNFLIRARGTQARRKLAPRRGSLRWTPPRDGSSRPTGPSFARRAV